MNHPDPHHEWQRETGRGLDRDGDCDERYTADVLVFENQHDAGRHEPDHQEFVVNSTDEVDEYQRVEDSEPQRDRGLAAHVRRQSRNCPHHQGEAGKHSDAQQHRSCDHVVAGDAGDRLTEQEEEWSVRRRRRRPDIADVVEEQAGIGHRTHRIRVEAVAQQRALRKVGVGVPAEHRDGQQ